MADEVEVAENAGVVSSGKPYPYSREQYLSAGQMLTLDMLHGELTFEELYNRDYRSILRSRRRRAAGSIRRAYDHLGKTFPPVEKYWEATDAVCHCLGGPATLRGLMEQPKSSWPASLEEKLRALHDLDVNVFSHLIPDDAKEGIVHFFSENGDDFLGKVGSLTLQDYYELPRSAYSQAELDLLYKGRRLGVLICHPDSFASGNSLKGKCWTGSICKSTLFNLVCNGDTATSDSCP